MAAQVCIIRERVVTKIYAPVRTESERKAQIVPHIMRRGVRAATCPELHLRMVSVPARREPQKWVTPAFKTYAGAATVLRQPVQNVQLITPPGVRDVTWTQSCNLTGRASG